MPSQEVLHEYYSQYYLTRTEGGARQERIVDLHRNIFEYLKRHLAPAPHWSFFDYGFGAGAFLRFVARVGHRAAGADVSAQNVRQLETRCREERLAINLVDLSQTTLASLGTERFDVITLFQVIEHVTEPRQLVDELSTLQRPGGLLYLECPNDRAALAYLKAPLQALFSRPMWRSLKYPEHLYGFNRRAVSALVEAAGYEVVDVGDYAYRDGVHQVESEFWWPRVSSNPKLLSIYGLSRSLIPLADHAISRVFGAGSGLFALARKRHDSWRSR